MKNKILLFLGVLFFSCTESDQKDAILAEYDFKKAAAEDFLKTKDTSWTRNISIDLKEISATDENINGNKATLRKYQPTFLVRNDLYTLGENGKFLTFIDKSNYREGLLPYKIIKSYNKGDTIDLISLERIKPVYSVAFYQSNNEWKILK